MKGIAEGSYNLLFEPISFLGHETEIVNFYD
jgi:hypothetical protein